MDIRWDQRPTRSGPAYGSTLCGLGSSSARFFDSMSPKRSAAIHRFNSGLASSNHFNPDYLPQRHTEHKETNFFVLFVPLWLKLCFTLLNATARDRDGSNAS